MASLPLLTVSDDSPVQYVPTTVYTAPATAGGGAVLENLLIDLLVTNITEQTAIAFDVTMTRAATTFYLEKEKILDGTTEEALTDWETTGEPQERGSYRLPFKVASLQIGDVIDVNVSHAFFDETGRAFYGDELLWYVGYVSPIDITDWINDFWFMSFTGVSPLAEPDPLITVNLTLVIENDQ